jgi:hypothetical protein
LLFQSGELEGITLNHIANAHKSKYITKLHAAQVTYSSTTLVQSTKLHGATPQEAIKLMARKEHTFPIEITTKFVKHKGRFLCLIAAYV